jgi:uncharacterized protein YlaN (UPF0358 family)
MTIERQFLKVVTREKADVPILPEMENFGTHSCVAYANLLQCQSLIVQSEINFHVFHLIYTMQKKVFQMIVADINSIYI